MRVRIRRSDGGYSDYDTCATPEWTLLEVLIWIRTHLDPDLYFVYSCKYNNSCKLCQVRINGKPGYLCVTRAFDGATIDPINESRQLRDTAVRWAPVW